LDPVTQLHVFFEDPLREQTLHVGLNRAFADYGMGIEVGIAGAEYHQDLLWGNTMIRIPVAGIQHYGDIKTNGVATFEIVVNASATTPSLKLVNVTVQHIDQGAIVWERNQVQLVQPGAVVRCQVSTNDTMTDFEVQNPLNPPFPLIPTEYIPFLGFVIVATIITILAMFVYRRKKK
jgi:hypothetical protein